MGRAAAPFGKAGPNEDYRLEDQIGFLLRKAHQAASEIFQTQAASYQVTPTQFSALIRLDALGELSQSALGELTAMDPATLLGVVQRLAKRGLLAIRPDPADGRRRLVRLTPAGHALARELRALGPTISDRTLAGLSHAERNELLRLLSRIGERRA